MEINLDEEVIKEQLNKSVDSAITQAFENNYEIKNIIKEKVAWEVIGKALVQAIDNAVSTVDLTSLSATLAKEIERTATATTVSMLRNYTASIMVKMNHPNAYGENLDKLIAAAMKKIEDHK